MNQLSLQRKAQVVKALCEGNSIRSTARTTGVAINTVVKLLVELGSACLDYQDATLRNLHCQRIQCDEIWNFVYAKAKNVPNEHKNEFGYGDVWTWTAICADSKLIPCWYVGGRSGQDAMTESDVRQMRQIALVLCHDWAKDTSPGILQKRRDPAAFDDRLNYEEVLAFRKDGNA